MIKNTKNKNRKPWVAIIPAMVTITLLWLFQSGMLFNIPRGTPKGGGIAAIGTAVIIFSVVAITYLITMLRKKKLNTDNGVSEPRKPV